MADESKSSNEIVEELRHTYPASGGPCLELTAADEIERLRQENLDLHAELSAIKSPEVCGAPHDNVEECGYCQRDRLRARIEDHNHRADAARLTSWLIPLGPAQKTTTLRCDCPTVKCARCGKVEGPMCAMRAEEGNEWECPDCNDRCDAAERAAHGTVNAEHIRLAMHGDDFK